MDKAVSNISIQYKPFGVQQVIAVMSHRLKPLGERRGNGAAIRTWDLLSEGEGLHVPFHGTLQVLLLLLEGHSNQMQHLKHKFSCLENKKIENTNI